MWKRIKTALWYMWAVIAGSVSLVLTLGFFALVGYVLFSMYADRYILWWTPHTTYALIHPQRHHLLKVEHRLGDVNLWVNESDRRLPEIAKRMP